MSTKTLRWTLPVLFTTIAWGGPPLICQQFETDGAQSLPWTTGADWHGADPNYNLARLTDETLALLTPQLPVPARMETLRRAAIYAAGSVRAADELTARLAARALDAEATGKADALAWFDAGYFVETVRQATFVYRYNMLDGKDRASWKLRGDTPRLDGYVWVQRAIRLGGKNMDHALSLMKEFREADLAAQTVAVSKR